MRDILRVEGLKKYYTGETGLRNLVLDNVNFSFSADEEQGRITAILAPYGAGKSSLLKIISGIEQASEGNIENILSDGVPIPYIPEKPSSYPWLTVKQNIEFGIKASLKEDNDLVNNLISMVGLSGYENHIPHNKSIGFRFRISLARALAVNPMVTLIDDSFKNMDSETRNEIYSLLISIKNLNDNFLLATTNIHEAIFLADEILLMKKNPGTIFRQIKIEKKHSDNDFLVADEVIELRREIELYYRAENVSETISFSI